MYEKAKLSDILSKDKDCNKSKMKCVLLLHMNLIFPRTFAYLMGVAGSFLPLPSGLVIVGGRAALEGDTDEVLAKRHDEEAVDGLRDDGEPPLG